MSRIDDILTGVQTAIEANATFTDAIVLMRKELKTDDEFHLLKVFLDIKNPSPLGGPFVSDLRTYPVEIVVRFTYEGRTVDEDVEDPVNALKGTYSDALKTAMRTCQSFSTYPIANVFHLEWISEDLEYKEDGEQYEDMAARDFRIQQIWNLYTYES